MVAALATARMTAFRPGQSPPPVIIPILFFFIGTLRSRRSLVIGVRKRRCCDWGLDSALASKRGAGGNPLLHKPPADSQQRRSKENADEAERQRAAQHAKENQDER